MILGKNDEPYSVLTDLGWSIVGSLTPCLKTGMMNSLCHCVAVKEIPPLTPMDTIRALKSNFKEVSGNDKTVSQEDLILFHQFQVQENNHNYLHFLLWKNGDLSTQPQEYRTTVHLFGAVSSPTVCKLWVKSSSQREPCISIRCPVHRQRLLCG